MLSGKHIKARRQYDGSMLAQCLGDSLSQPCLHPGICIIHSRRTDNLHASRCGMCQKAVIHSLHHIQFKIVGFEMKAGRNVCRCRLCIHDPQTRAQLLHRFPKAPFRGSPRHGYVQASAPNAEGHSPRPCVHTDVQRAQFFILYRGFQYVSGFTPMRKYKKLHKQQAHRAFCKRAYHPKKLVCRT